MPETAYARCDDLSLAYQVFGEGPVDLVIAGSFVSHIELMWGSPEIKVFYDRVATFARVAHFDKAGVGLSDPVAKVRSIEERAEEIETIMDAAGMERAAIVGISEGGPAAIVFAASRPDRVSSLVLVGTFAAAGVSDWSLADAPLATLREQALETYPPEYALTDTQLERVQSMVRAVRDRWGSGEALSHLLPSVRSKQLLGTLERMSASPGMARATLEAGFRIDTRDVLDAITVPTLVIHARDDFVPVQYGRYIADHIPGARLLEVEGSDHAPWLSAPDRILSEMERFLTGSIGRASTDRALRTVLFTDIVRSTERAAELGDERWLALLERFDATTRATVDRYGGTLVKATGDGHLATFDGPARAIRGAEAIRDEAGDLGLGVRVGIHTGECELVGADIGGIAVHIASRVMNLAAPGEILVSSTVRDLIVGSGVGLEERGSHELRGVPGEWTLLAVRSGGAAAGSREAALVSQPTPSPRTTMRRSDRVVGAVVKRAPVLVRAMARVDPRSR